MATDLMSLVEATQLRTDHPDFAPGDTVRVHVRVIEGDKERVQIYEGVVIGIQNGGASKTFTVRKISNGVGVERVFPFASPRIARVELVREGRVRRAKLYYLRGLRGKAARIAEKRQDNRGGKNVAGGKSSSPKAGSAGRLGSGSASGQTAPPNPGETKVTGSASQKNDESNVPGIKN